MTIFGNIATASDVADAYARGLEAGRAPLDRLSELILTVALEQLREYREELTEGQIKLIAHQIACEATRRISSDA